MRTITLIALVLAAGFACGGGAGDWLEGTWRLSKVVLEKPGGEKEEIDLIGYGAKWKIEADRTLVNLTSKKKGTWELDGKNLRVKWEDGGGRDYELLSHSDDEFVGARTKTVSGEDVRSVDTFRRVEE